MRKIAALALLAAISLGSRIIQCEPAPVSHPPADTPFVAEDLGTGYVAIDGSWAFHPGDNTAWAAPDFDDTSWPRIQTGRPWEGQGYPSLTGFAWYRRRVTLPRDLSPGWQIGILLGDVEDAAEVYWNGRLVGSFGKVPPHPVWFGAGLSTPAIANLGPAASQPAQGVLAIRVWKAPYAYLASPDMGGLTRTPLIGSAETLAVLRTSVYLSWLRAHQYALSIALISGLISLFALLAWLRDRRQWMLFWLALYCIRPLALLLAERLPGVSWRLSYGSVGMIYAATDAALWFLLLYLLGLAGNRSLFKGTTICACIAFGCQIFEGSEQLFDWTQAPRFFLLADIGLTIPSLLVQLWPILLVVFAVRKRLDAARWMVAIFAMLADLVSNSLSWFSLGNRWTHWTLGEIIDTPLFTIAGNQFSVLILANTLLLVAIVYAVLRYEREQNRRQVRLSQEFRNAQELQQLLIPESLPQLPGMMITSAYRPAQEVGGDFFQLFPLPGDSALLVLGDVSGKGLHAAMTVALIVGAIHSTIEVTTEPVQILEALNRRLHNRLRNGFATCLVLRFDRAGKYLIANAGHLPPFINGRELEIPNSLPLGLIPEVQYESVEVQLAPGDRLTVYTDGLLEARNAAGELFGFSRIAALLENSPNAEQIAATAQAFGQEDDITVLTVAFHGRPQEAASSVGLELEGLPAEG
ncbi:MAG TPA: SpoIIE family protein phosphatase [Terracidiphilus sp.]|nr:SpoIIE family protein phosphatase [Terracidiphilus sp.]